MIFLNIDDDKTCHNKKYIILINFLNKTNGETHSAKVNKCLYLGTEGVRESKQDEAPIVCLHTGPFPAVVLAGMVQRKSPKNKNK
jgi:hypothetical protein